MSVPPFFGVPPDRPPGPPGAHAPRTITRDRTVAPMTLNRLRITLPPYRWSQATPVRDSYAPPVRVGDVWLFPGQGSQSVGMGKALADAFPDAAHTYDEANDAL